MLILIEAAAVAENQDNFFYKFYPEFLKSDYTKGILTFFSNANKQERLFWFNSPSFMIKIIHLCEISGIVVLVMNYNFLTHLSNYNCLKEIIILSIALGFYFFITLLIIPPAIVKFSIISNILMLRNFERADEAINILKRRLYSSYVRVYR